MKVKDESYKIEMNIRDMDAEFELEAMAEPNKNGDLCILVVECEPLETRNG